MGMTMAYGKILSWTSKDDRIGLDTIPEYKDQRGVEAKLDLKKFVEKAKKCKQEDNIRFFNEWIPLIENNGLSIGVPIIDGMSRIVSELGKEAFEILKEDKK